VRLMDRFAIFRAPGRQDPEHGSALMVSGEEKGGSGLSPSEHQRIALRNGAPTGAKGSSLSSGVTLP
jgi:hypothetical protein